MNEDLVADEMRSDSHGCPLLDISVGGGRDVPMETRKQRIHAEALRLSELGAATQRVLAEPGLDHYAITMTDPEGNEFDIN